MALTVEDGSNVSGADAFVSASACSSFLTARGSDAFSAAATGKQESAIRRATQYLSAAINWRGERAHGRDQPLAWPRSGVYDVEGWYVQPDAVPVEVRDATCLLAELELESPGALNPQFTLAGQRRSLSIAGALSQTTIAAAKAEDLRACIAAADDLIRNLARPREQFVGRA